MREFDEEMLPLYGDRADEINLKLPDTERPKRAPLWTYLEGKHYAKRFRLYHGDPRGPVLFECANGVWMPTVLLYLREHIGYVFRWLDSQDSAEIAQYLPKEIQAAYLDVVTACISSYRRINLDPYWRKTESRFKYEKLTDTFKHIETGRIRELFRYHDIITPTVIVNVGGDEHRRYSIPASSVYEQMLIIDAFEYED